MIAGYAAEQCTAERLVEMVAQVAAAALVEISVKENCRDTSHASAVCFPT